MTTGCHFNIDYVKRSFYSACNCIAAHGVSLGETVHLSLQENYCVPVLNHASAAIQLLEKAVLRNGSLLELHIPFDV